MSPYDLCVQGHRLTHLHDKHSDFFRRASSHLDYPSTVDVSLEVLFPGDPLTDPGEDGSQPLNVTSVRPTYVSLRQACCIGPWWKAVDKTSTLIHKLKVHGTEIRRILYRVAIRTFVTLRHFIQSLYRGNCRIVNHLAFFSPFNPFVMTERIRSIDIPSDLYPVSAALAP